VLVVGLGFLLSEMELRTAALWTWFATVQEKFPAPNGLDHPVPTGLMRKSATA
jgi:hypothetical protein